MLGTIAAGPQSSCTFWLLFDIFSIDVDSGRPIKDFKLFEFVLFSSEFRLILIFEKERFRSYLTHDIDNY